MYLVVYGPEGSGKGTQAKLLAEKLNLPIYTSGDIVREKAAKDKGLIGEICRQALINGKYVSDKTMFILWEDKLKRASKNKGFILDGFPRTLKQAQFLSKNIQTNGYRIDKFIHLGLSDEEAVKRLILRKRNLYEGSKIMHDDPTRVKQRLAFFREQEKAIIKYYDKKKLLLDIDAKGTIEQVFSKIYHGLGFSK